MIRVVKTIAFYTILLAACELGAKLWIGRYGNALDATRSILEADALLGWKQRSELRTKFQGFPLSTNEYGFRERPFATLPARPHRVLILGPSSTFGWGVAEQDTYAAQLERLPGMGDFTVVNAGEIGFSTAQGRILFAQAFVKALRPDFVVLAYGINDLDHNRFYFQSPLPDREELARVRSGAAIEASRLLFRSDLIALLVKSAAAIRGAATQAPTVANPRVRVPPADYAENMRALIEASRPAQVILLSTAVHMPVAEAPEKIRAEVARINRGVDEYNEILRAEARGGGAMLGDVTSWLQGEPPEAVFVDPVHFSAKGNALVAKGLASMLKSPREGKL